MDLHRTLRAPGLTGEVAPEPDAVLPDFEAEAPSPDYVVIATQGRGDEKALVWALMSGASHIAFVGSRAKFAALSARLAEKDIDASRVQAPAGMPIGAVTPEEIALSVLAQVVAWRRTPRPETA
ncbi:MAG: XdhC family protein, partial [Pseudomonadota bacterium]